MPPPYPAPKGYRWRCIPGGAVCVGAYRDQLLFDWRPPRWVLIEAN